jgi:hypothetical protein
MKAFKTTLMCACLALAAGSAAAADDAMTKAPDAMKSSMPNKDGMADKGMPTMQQCKDQMAMEKKNPAMKKDDATMKMDTSCTNMMKNDGMMKKDSMPSDAMKKP